MKGIISNIRKNSFIDFIKAVIPTLLFSGMSIGFLYATFVNKFNVTSLFLSIVFLPFAIFALIQTTKSIKLIINPFNSNVFKKYGSVEKIVRIYDEIDRTTEFKNDSIVISKNYLCDKKRAENLVAFNDVLAIHKLVHKVNFQVDYYQIVITDKYGEEIRFKFGRKEENLVDFLIETIANRTPNAEVGYTQDELDHIQRNKIPLNNSSNINNYGSDPFTATFKSDEQKRAERIKATKRQITFKNFWKCIGCIALSIISSEMLLMIILGDAVEGATALVLLFVVAIPFFVLFYYLFIARKK